MGQKRNPAGNVASRIHAKAVTVGPLKKCATAALAPPCRGQSGLFAGDLVSFGQGKPCPYPDVSGFRPPAAGFPICRDFVPASRGSTTGRANPARFFNSPTIAALLTLSLAAGMLHETASAAGQSDPLVDTARAVADRISDKPEGIDKLFAKMFLDAVPASQLSAILVQLHESCGKVTSVTLQSRVSPNEGKFVFLCAKQVEIPVSLTIDGKSHQVTGLWFGPPSPAVRTLGEVVKRLGQLPGRVSLQLERLGGNPKVIQSLNADETLAIGSTFKLLVLGTLVEANTPWDKVIRLDAGQRSLPSGEMRDWPAGAPVTVHTLALKMISQSDNTAADHLLYLAGREKVEQFQQAAGIKAPARNIPFLSTAEMFRLKGAPVLLKKYTAADAAGRRAMLATEVPKAPLDAAGLELGRPIAIEQVEWFASTADLCRVMRWFLEKNDAGTLEILAVNPGLDARRDKLAYAGYKGGSEAGVINMTWLLKTASGEAYALSGTWNDPDKALEEEKFIGLMQAILNLVAEGAVER